MKTYRNLAQSVWALGFVSLFMDMSSELVHSLLPVYMAPVLGASMVTIGLVEGTAEATAAIAKVFSGAVSDRLGKRKALGVIGYGLSALTKLVFPLASTIGWVFGARFADRVGKGIRGAPRDALVADIVPQRQRGAAYGLRQALDSTGAFLGPLLALAFMAWFSDDIRKVLWVAVVPAFLAVLVLITGVSEPAPSQTIGSPGGRLAWGAVASLPRRFWLVVSLGAVFTLARFSEAFLILRGQDLGLTLGYVPLILIVMNVVYSAIAYPAGLAADLVSARRLFLVGLGVLISADVLLATAATPWMIFPGAALWGLHMALTQGLLSKLVVDASPAHLRGTAFGIFHLVNGGALLLASAIAGAVWTLFGAPVTFMTGAGFSLLAAVALLLYHPRGVK